jgi:DNA-binding response OmpR family regulator
MQVTGRVRLFVIDPDEAMQAEAGAMAIQGFDVHRHPPRRPASVADAMPYDIAVIGVDTAAGLQLLADLCSSPGAPPVIGIAGQGFEGKSLEHVLLLAEVRGAAATMTKPASAAEIALAVRAVMGLRQPVIAQQKRA